MNAKLYSATLALGLVLAMTSPAFAQVRGGSGGSSGTGGDASAANQIAGNANLAALASAVGSAQPAACTGVIPISQITSTDIKTLTNKGQICSIVLVAPDAEVISLVQGTGTVCATGIAALIGATTAANGISLAANGGFTATSSAPWLVMTTTAQHLCLLQSGSGRVAGVITYVDK
jgi:hypothetical protein